LNRAVPLPFLPNLVDDVAGLIVVAASFLFGGAAVVNMRRSHSSPNPYKPTAALVETGVFHYTRNPLYVSLFVLYIGIAVIANVLWLILLFPFLFLLVESWVVKREEVYLEQKFGEAYRYYKRRSSDQALWRL
jgi:protein-S-isoprenylcysteine O-methyltransferase Ste14